MIQSNRDLSLAVKQRDEIVRALSAEHAAGGRVDVTDESTQLAIENELLKSKIESLTRHTQELAAKHEAEKQTLELVIDKLKTAVDQIHSKLFQQSPSAQPSPATLSASADGSVSFVNSLVLEPRPVVTRADPSGTTPGGRNPLSATSTPLSADTDATGQASSSESTAHLAASLAASSHVFGQEPSTILMEDDEVES